jgi:ATP-dependent exoDNAse (exonuclease V) beta subunit
VADFKTDRVGGRSLNAVAQHHASQGEIYTEAVQKALQLDAPPAFEVWLVEVDQYVTVTASLGD